MVRIETMRELVLEVNSPNKISNLKFYQIGGEQEIWFTTPIEIECSNVYGTETLRRDLKNGHMIRETKQRSLDVKWNEDETGGVIQVWKNGPFEFSCKMN